jgi:hypothetical protein
MPRSCDGTVTTLDCCSSRMMMLASSTAGVLPGLLALT